MTSNPLMTVQLQRLFTTARINESHEYEKIISTQTNSAPRLFSI